MSDRPLKAGERARGHISVWYARERYGFLALDPPRASRLFLHGSELPNGVVEPKPGEMFAFTIAPSPARFGQLHAANVQRLGPTSKDLV